MFDPGFYDFPSPSSPGFRSRFPIFPNDMDDGLRNFDPEHRNASAEPGPVPESIPIRVIHERTSNATPPKNRLNASSGRNTTEIPARPAVADSPNNNIHADKSPRLERAHSEPPKLFNQRLRQGGAASPASQPTYSTIPENSEPASVGSPRFPTAEGSTTSAAPNHKLSSSASAPSVPASNQGRPSPVPPPRRNKLDREDEKSGKDLPPAPPPPPPQQHQQQHSNSEAPKVRHIPIFVEGRDEPVLQRKTSGGESGGGGGGFRQPSEFYPPNVQKVRSQSVSSPGATVAGGHGRGGLNLKPHHLAQQQNPLEPTSPLSPPPSDQPIPMGCSEYFVHSAPNPEPTTPAPPPPGPIPMPFCPDVVDGSTTAPPAPEVFNVPVKVVETPAAAATEPAVHEKPEAKPKVENLSPAEAKLRKIESEVEELLQRVEKFNGCKKDREYLYLDDLLTQKLCLLDGIDSEGRDDIRKMRKDSIKTINRCLSILDRRATPKVAAKGGDEKCDDGDAADVANKVLSDLAKVDGGNDDDGSNEKSDAPKK